MLHRFMLAIALLLASTIIATPPALAQSKTVTRGGAVVAGATLAWRAKQVYDASLAAALAIRNGTAVRVAVQDLVAYKAANPVSGGLTLRRELSVIVKRFPELVKQVESVADALSIRFDIPLAEQARTANPSVPDRAFSLPKKIRDQAEKRGWSEEEILDTIKNPKGTKKSRDRRNKDEKDGGGNNDDPATAYFIDDNHYVVANDRTGEIIQITNRYDHNWIPKFYEP